MAKILGIFTTPATCEVERLTVTCVSDIEFDGMLYKCPKIILEKMSAFNYVLFHYIFQITQNSCKIPKVSKSKAEFLIRNSTSRIVSTSG